jgi:hypothetical protein
MVRDMPSERIRDHVGTVVVARKYPTASTG